MSDAPETLFLQWIPEQSWFEDEVAWGVDRINDDDVQYIRTNSPRVHMPLDLLKQVLDWDTNRSYDDDFPSHLLVQIKMLVGDHQTDEWVNKKRFDELKMAYNELVDHHAKHHKEEESIK
jgi:hypothetical protein